MPRSVVESYAASRPGRLEGIRGHARLAGEAGAHVEYLRTTFLPDDEVVLHVFEAGTAESLPR